jgi:hypothetical protein
MAARHHFVLHQGDVGRGAAKGRETQLQEQTDEFARRY